MPEKNWEAAQAYLLAGGFSGFVGWAAYIAKCVEGKEFRWSELFINVVFSALAGLICFEVLRYFDLPERLCGMLSGVAGFGGSRCFKIAWLLIESRASAVGQEIGGTLSKKPGPDAGKDEKK